MGGRGCVLQNEKSVFTPDSNNTEKGKKIRGWHRKEPDRQLLHIVFSQVFDPLFFPVHILPSRLMPLPTTCSFWGNLSYHLMVRKHSTLSHQFNLLLLSHSDRFEIKMNKT